jgi:hypothetical protein
MKFLKRALLGLVLLVVLLLGVGLLLPARFHVERSIQINAPAASIYALIATPRQWPSWAVWNQRDPDMQLTFSGPDSGAGAAWSWVSKTEGNGEMTFTAATADQQVLYRLSFPEFGMSSDGELSLKPSEGSVQVRWTNSGEMNFNPINRWFGLFMDKLVGPDFEAGLARLKQVAEAQAIAAHSAAAAANATAASSERLPADEKQVDAQAGLPETE